MTSALEREFMELLKSNEEFRLAVAGLTESFYTRILWEDLRRELEYHSRRLKLASTS